jgi:glyoxylase-like metal-dependent hydrolase (beta-lactamase superfamily II)
MLDCGIHPGLSGENSLPFLTNEDLDDIDAALITHFHLDHCAALPWLLKETTFKVEGGGWWVAALVTMPLTPASAAADTPADTPPPLPHLTTPPIRAASS